MFMLFASSNLIYFNLLVHVATRGAGTSQLPQPGAGTQRAEDVQATPSDQTNLVTPCPLGLTIGCIGNAEPGLTNASTENPNSSSDGSGDDGGF